MQKPYLKLSAATAPVPAPPLSLLSAKFPQEQYAAWQLNLTRPLLLTLSQPAAVARLNSLNSKPNPPYAMLISGTSFWLRTAPATQL